VYEGHPIRAVTFPVRLLHALGARGLIVTNAAGSTNVANGPGTIMFITDHINMAFANPLVGPNVDGGPRFVDMSEPYDLAWIEEAEQAALSEGVATRRGVYLWTMGPSYETKAEIQAYRTLGADVVGMSTVPEVLQGRYLGMRVLGISTITNLASGLSDEPLSHNDVLAVGERLKGDLIRLLDRIVRGTSTHPKP
jgi:purine-nucleoside phosphorylase